MYWIRLPRHSSVAVKESCSLRRFSISLGHSRTAATRLNAVEMVRPVATMLVRTIQRPPVTETRLTQRDNGSRYAHDFGHCAYDFHERYNGSSGQLVIKSGVIAQPDVKGWAGTSSNDLRAPPPPAVQAGLSSISKMYPCGVWIRPCSRSYSMSRCGLFRTTRQPVDESEHSERMHIPRQWRLPRLIWLVIRRNLVFQRGC